MKKNIFYTMGLFVFILQASGASLNEWTFEKDAEGLTLSQAINSGSEQAVFSAGGDGFLLTDGNGSLECSHGGSEPDGMWSDGAVLDADVDDVLSGSLYLRCDLNYDLSSVGRVEDFAVGLSILDGVGANVAGVVLVSESNAPAGQVLIPVASDLLWEGKISTIVRVDISTQTLTAWYDLTGTNHFDEAHPAVTDVSVSLTSVDKLRFQATGDIRPIGSVDYVAMDNIRVAFSWEDIVAPVAAPLRVNPLFCDHMVLQRDQAVPVWGRITPGAPVTAVLDGTTAAATVADETGRWVLHLPAQAQDGGEPHTLVFSSPGAKDIQINDVVYGEVFLASGQSNMDRDMDTIVPPGLAEEKEAAEAYSLIRQVAVSRISSTTAQEEPSLRSDGWVPCSASTVGGFSATAYFFAKTIYLKTGMPIGIIQATWGGQPIERFLCPEGISAVPELSGIRQEQDALSDLYDIYNSLIHPLIPYAIRGVIWYQGENNANLSEGDLYRLKMQALIRGWRQNWGQGDFPFYFVQLANFANSHDWPGLREAQFNALMETNTGMAVIIDIGEDGDIHPHNKQDVGDRLAQWTLAKDLGQSLTYSGPLYHQAVVDGSQIRVVFDYADDGLLVGQKDSTNPVSVVDGPLQNFEIAGADRIFADASAIIDRDSIIVSNAAVASPMYVRYCYANAPAGPNKLYNAAGLPASPFRTDSSYRLDVKSGSGAATGLIAGTQIAVTAASPPSGKVFDRWIGAADEVEDLNAATTTVTMPARGLYLVATYRDESDSAFTLTVSGGYGSGTSQSGSILNIKAASINGQMFDHWSGDTQTVVNVKAASTTLQMPADNVTVTAVYRAVDSVNDGISDDWRAGYFGGDGSTTNAQSAAGSDPDGDGMTNEQEFHAGTSPIDAESVLRLTGRFNRGKYEFRFSSVAGKRYRLEKTATLTPIDWKPVFYSTVGSGSEKELLENADTANSGFYRLLSN